MLINMTENLKCPVNCGGIPPYRIPVKSLDLFKSSFIVALELGLAWIRTLETGTVYNVELQRHSNGLRADAGSQTDILRSLLFYFVKISYSYSISTHFFKLLSLCKSQ